jgi:succinate-semialdehyde dehydrogenase/glutarate-semialdehyde dehydrogenase
MPAQIDVIRHHISDAIARGGRAVLGGPEAVQPPLVLPTVLVDVPPEAPANREETFGPTMTITRVADAAEAVALANSTS